MAANVLAPFGFREARLWTGSAPNYAVNGRPIVYNYGANIAYVQRLLGHRRIETTQVYTRVTPNEARASHRRAHPRAGAKAVASPAPVAMPGNLIGPR